jgi:hypothetical protein
MKSKVKIIFWELLKSGTRQNLLISIFIKLRRLSIIPYCLICGSIALLGSLLITGTTIMLGLDLESHIGEYGADINLTLNQVLGVGVVWPVIETAILTTFLHVLFKSKLTEHQCCIVSALLWGVLHGLLVPMKFLTASWTFYIFSISFWLWKKRGYKKAFIAAALPHIILNSAALVLMFL